MTIAIKVVCCIVTILLMAVNPASPAATLQAPDPLSCRVTLVANGATIDKLLSMLSLQAQVRIGFEEVSAGDFGGAKLINVAIRQEPLKDALNAIVVADDRYDWRLVDSIINVMPKRKDACISDVVISNFSVHDVAIGDMPFALLETPELKDRLVELGLRYAEYKEKADEPRLQVRITLSRVNWTVKDILNDLLRTGSIRNWAIIKYGDRRDYVAIVIS
jgi:hypothetical protein